MRLIALVTLATCAIGSPAAAQLRGTAVFLEPSYGYDWRFGADVGYGGSGDEGFAVAATAARQFWIGNCRRVTGSLGIGLFNPEEEDDDLPAGTTVTEIGTGVNVGGTGWVVLNSCPDVTSEPTWLVWAYAGGGAFRAEGRTAWSSSIGFAVMYRWDDLAIGKIEPWVVPRLQYVQGLAPGADDDTELAFSTGFNIGVGGAGALRIAFDCCIGGGGEWSWGFSFWRALAIDSETR